MLPEHRERLIQNRQGEAGTAPRKNVPTAEELTLIREYALLPLILSIVETNLRSIENTTYSLRKLYMKAAQSLLELIHSDLVRVRKTLKERDIKVYEEERIDNTIQFRFLCRGYEDRFTMVRDVVRAEASVRIAKYIAALFRK